VGLEGGAYFEEDTAYQPPLTDAKEIRERDEKVHQARERKWVALDALQVLAFDGEEAEPFQAWMLDRLDWMMSTCDVCVRVFHQSRADWRAHLIEYALSRDFRDGSG
jgi:senataxin